MRAIPAAALLLPPIVSMAAPSSPSFSPVLTLNPINLSSYFTYTTPAHAGPRLGSISFTLRNSQVDYDTHCEGSTMSFGQFYAYQTFECATPNGTAWKDASFSYDSNTKTISLNSTWTCGRWFVFASRPGPKQSKLISAQRSDTYRELVEHSESAVRDDDLEKRGLADWRNLFEHVYYVPARFTGYSGVASCVKSVNEWARAYTL
jgi:hypothetical protein